MSFYKAQIGTELIIFSACGLFAGAAIELNVMGYSLSTTTIIGSVPPVLAMFLCLLLIGLVFRESASAYHSTQNTQSPEQAANPDPEQESAESPEQKIEDIEK